MLIYNLSKIPQIRAEIKPYIWMNNCSGRKAREQEYSQKKLKVYINTQFVLVSSNQGLKQIINFNKKLVKSNAEQ